MCASTLEEKEKVCVNCGWGVRTLYVQYSPGNIRLMKCENCMAVADPYIECEFMIILIDLILHKPKAYRHLMCNTLNLNGNGVKGILWKSSLSYILIAVCRFSLLTRSYYGPDSLRSSSGAIRMFGKIAMDALFGNFVLTFCVLLGTKIMLASSYTATRFIEILAGILVSSFFKLFIIAMMVWDFPFSVLPIIDVFVLSSNVVALKVLTQARTIGCMKVCFSAHAANFLTNYWLLPLLFGSSKIL